MANAKMDRPPAFFKVFFPQTSGQQMTIPYTELTYPENVKVRDSHGNVWHMKMERDSEGYHFTEGWAQFMNYHRLNPGEILVFEYVAFYRSFNVKIFDLSACEKKLNAAPIAQETAPVEQEIEHQNKADEQNNSETDNDDNEAGELNNDELDDYEYNEAGKESDGEVKNLNEPVADVEGEEEVEAPSINKRRRRKRIPDLYGTEIFRAGLAPLPENPFFVTSINVSRKHELYIPMDLVKRVHVDIPSELSLVDPSGRKYSVRRTIWKNGRTYYIGGWTNLCQENDVEEKDQCIMEFVRTENGEPRINVTIIRADDIQQIRAGD